MQRKMPWLSISGIVLVLAGIVGYNIWAYSCGYCAIQDMKVVGPQVKGVGLLVTGAAIYLVFLYSRRSDRKTAKDCNCGRYADPAWHHCPDCGARLK